MRLQIFAALFVMLAPALAEDAPGAPPEWFLKEIKMITADGGRWIADNAAYVSDEEKFDHYGMEWKSSFGGTIATGRLFGIADGEETVDFWEFRQYWHPGRKEAVIEQFGWGGALGIGTFWPMKNGSTKLHQVFFSADGAERKEGHIGSFPDANTHITTSYDAEGDNWIEKRSYTWKRQRAE